LAPDLTARTLGSVAVGLPALAPNSVDAAVWNDHVGVAAAAAGSEQRYQRKNANKQGQFDKHLAQTSLGAPPLWGEATQWRPWLPDCGHQVR
jgi:hypothetical protein